MNCVTMIAAAQGRTYITPEDVADALKHHSVDLVRLNTLEVLGKQTEFGAEDFSLCAFIAWKGLADQ